MDRYFTFQWGGGGGVGWGGVVFQMGGASFLSGSAPHGEGHRI